MRWPARCATATPGRPCPACRRRGVLLAKQSSHILIDVQGVGYEVEVPLTTFFRLPAPGEEVMLHTHLIVREDAHVLYGFAAESDRALFRDLIKVNGVGAKLAATILSGIAVEEFVRSVRDGDVARLTRLPGIGKKTAERLVMEMRDRLDVKGTHFTGMKTEVTGPAEIEPNPVDDAVAALVALGYKPPDASRMVLRVKADGLACEEIIRRALQGGLRAWSATGPRADLRRAGWRGIIALGPVVEEVLYPAMEDYQLDIMIGEGPAARSSKLDLPPFTLVGATTRAGLLTSPLRDRFGIVQRLEFYSTDDLISIVQRSATILNLAMEREGATEIARRSRGTPRIANRLLRRVRDYAEVKADGRISGTVAEQALNMLDVDREGFDMMDRKLLLTLIDKFDGGPVGIDSLAAAIGEERGTIEDVLEPFLIQQGYLMRTARGRVATRHAYLHFGLRAPASPTPDEATEIC